MVKIMENPIKMDDLGVPVFLETVMLVFLGGCIFGDFFFKHHGIHHLGQWSCHGSFNIMKYVAWDWPRI